MIDAQEMGANYFNLGSWWRVFNYLGGGARVANRGFIDASTARGAAVFLESSTVWRSHDRVLRLGNSIPL
jgi:hypothetical protein